MKNLTCIVCPIGCSLDVDDHDNDNLSVTGNRCARGAAYAKEEIRAPKRIVTATVPIVLKDCETDVFSVRRIPVKTTAACLKEKIPQLLADIYKITVNLPVKVGDILIKDWNKEGFDIITTRSFNVTQFKCE